MTDYTAMDDKELAHAIGCLMAAPKYPMLNAKRREELMIELAAAWKEMAGRIQRLLAS